MTKNAKNEQLEEGEIVDDDDLEDISDNSIINSSFGKFVSPYENLRAPYLSSDSDSDRLLKHKRKLIRKLKQKQQKKRKRVRLLSDSSDSDVSPPRDLKGKLKEAVHINDDEGAQKKTLESRLKAVGALPATPQLSNDQKEEEIPNAAAELSDKSEDDLENLRLEALKTAILNKCQKRKRKKVAEKQEENPPQENKENTPKVEPIAKKTAEQAAPAINFDEDEDILRASLLAGLAKKIAKKDAPTETPLQIKQLPIKTIVNVKTALPKRITKFNNKLVNKKVVNKIQKVNIPKPQVKPLIINVNDSDSDEEVKKNNVIQPEPVVPPIKPKAQDLTTITSNVERFLKEQRAKFEIENKVREKQDLSKNKSVLEKSAVKLLPKSQQIEYQLLLKRLRNAERQKKAKKMAMEKAKTEPPEKVTVNVPQVGESVKVNADSAPKVEIVSKSETVNSECSCCGNSSNKPDSLEKRSAIITELTTLQRTLKEIKTQKNGSLQIKGKYQALTPIIRKITATSNERKKQEQRIRTLMKELNEARSNLAKSHEQFSKLVRELVSKKEKIELSYEQQRAKLNELQKIKLLKESKPVTSTPIKPQPIVDETAISTIVSSSTNNECEDMDVCNSDEDCHIDIVDPNDIDQIFKRKTPVKPSIPEYISPLNFNNGIRFNRNVDPHGIMCPYEVNGSCRDIDCTYKHYLKNHE